LAPLLFIRRPRDTIPQALTGLEAILCSVGRLRINAMISSRLHYGWVVLVMGTLVVFGSLGLARFGYTMVLPDMQEGLGIDNAQTGALATANLVGYLVLAVIGGVVASRYGPRVVIAAGLGLAGASMVLTGLATGFPDAAAWRVVTGIGSGASNVPVMALLAAWFATRRRGLASGIAVAGSALGLIFAGAVVPRVLSAYGVDGWRTCWFIFGGITLLLAVGSFILLRNRPADVGQKPMGAGSEEAVPTQRTGGLQWSRVYRSRTVWHLGLVYVAFGFSYIIYMTFFTKHLIAEGGYTQDRAGDLFMTMGWVSLVCGLLWGTVSDVIGRRRALIIVYLIHAVAFSLFALWTTPAGFTLSAVLFGLSAWSIPAIMAAACGDVLGPRLAPAALGLITLLFGIGQAVAPSIAGAMADATGSFFAALLLAAGVALLGALGAFLLRPHSAPPVASAGGRMEYPSD
jgi:sugar phosphate permease